MKKIIIMLFFILAIFVQGSELEKQIDFKPHAKAHHHGAFSEIIRQTGLAIIFETSNEFPVRLTFPVNSKLKDALNQMCGSDYSWELKNQVIIIQPKINSQIPSEKYQIALKSGMYTSDKDGAGKFLSSLWKYRLLLEPWPYADLNYAAMNLNGEFSIIDVLSSLMKDSRALMTIYKTADIEIKDIYKKIAANDKYDAKAIFDFGQPFWELSISESLAAPAPQTRTRGKPY